MQRCPPAFGRRTLILFIFTLYLNAVHLSVLLRFLAFILSYPYVIIPLLARLTSFLSFSPPHFLLLYSILVGWLACEYQALIDEVDYDHKVVFRLGPSIICLQ